MRKSILVLTLLAATGLGCGPRFAVPSWSSPGPAEVQRQRAERFDPYPADLSRSEMTGARPRDYDKPATDRQEPWSPNFSNAATAGKPAR